MTGHEELICAVDAVAGIIASSDMSGRIIIWSSKAALEGAEAVLAGLTYVTFSGIYDWLNMELGRNFLVRSPLDSESRKVQVVTDFPLQAGPNRVLSEYYSK